MTALLETAVRLKYHAMANSIREYQSGKEHIDTVRDAALDLFKKTPLYRKKRSVFRAVASASSVSLEKTGGRSALRLTLAGKEIAISTDTLTGVLALSLWTARNPAADVIRSADTKNVRSMEDLYNHWEKTLDVGPIADAARRYQDAIRTIVLAATSQKKPSGKKRAGGQKKTSTLKRVGEGNKGALRHSRVATET